MNRETTYRPSSNDIGDVDLRDCDLQCAGRRSDALDPSDQRVRGLSDNTEDAERDGHEASECAAKELHVG